MKRAWSGLVLFFEEESILDSIGTKKRQILRMTLLSCLLLVLFACASPMKKVQVSSKFVANDRLPSLKLAILPLNGKIEGAEFFREALHAALMDTEMNISEKFVVDGIIKKNGWNTSEKLFAIPPQKLGEAFGADALLYGKVTKWNKYYAVIHSTLVVGLELKLVDARTGELLWRGQQVDKEFEGLIKVPTGIISAIVNPLFFVGEKSNLDALASKVARNITESLRKPYAIKEVDKMDQIIILASADEYIKKIEENNVVTEINPVEETLVDDSLPSPESTSPDFIKTAEAEEKDVHFSKPEKQSELQETNDVAPMPERSSVISQGGRATAKRATAQLPNKKSFAKKTQFYRFAVQKPSSTDIKSVSLKTAGSADKKAPISKPSKTVPEKKNIYTIQVGAFQSWNYAKTLIEKLKRKGYNSIIAMARIGKKMLYKVQVDQFKTKSKAILYAKKLRKKENLQYFITKTDVAPLA
ncbi:MAG: GNA1162 family protein [Nitrospinota bacterium]